MALALPIQALADKLMGVTAIGGTILSIFANTIGRYQQHLPLRVLRVGDG